MEGKYKLSADVEKTTHLPVPLVVFGIVFILLVVILMFFVYMQAREDSIGFLVIGGILLLFPIGMFYGIYETMKSSRSMKKHIKDGTIIAKKVKITRFSYYYSSDNHGLDEGYYVIATDGMNEYKSKLFKRAVITGGYYKQSIDEDFLQKNGIPYSPKDPLYNTEVVLRRIKEIDDEIDLLTEEKKSKSFFAKIKINSKISDLNLEKDRLFPPSFVCGGRSLYIGDEVTVLVDPDDPKNYEMKI